MERKKGICPAFCRYHGFLESMETGQSVMQIDVDILRQCWFLAGPTAVGKSETGVELANLLDAEIVSLDSMSLYRGMNIGTAKPSLELRSRVPHHLIDVLEPDEDYSVTEYIEAARTACVEILARNHIPLFVGGTGLYLCGLLRGVFTGPPADWELRRNLAQEAAENEPGYLHRRLETIDPDAAAFLHPNDTRRLIRAIEVHQLTGRPLSQQQRETPLPPEARPSHVYWLLPPRDWLYERINRRVEQMFADGLVDEIRHLLELPQPLGRTARQALGYKEILDAFETNNGSVELAQNQITQLVALIQTRTRQFAKRQFTWFRNLVEAVPVEISGAETSTALAQRIVRIAKR